MANITFNPALMTSPQNSFLLETQGWMQGLTQDDPVSRMYLTSGILDAGITQPVWGGMGITANTAQLATNNRQGSDITLASTTHITGFTVFDQAISMIQVPGNTVPTANAGQNIAYYAFGSSARIPLPLASGVITALEGVPTTTQLYWDTVNFVITNVTGTNMIALPAGVQLLAVNANSKTVQYSGGVASWLDGQNACLIQI